MIYKRTLIVILFTVAMAYLESAIVVYLRDLYDIVNLIEDTPTRPDSLTLIEIGRESATLVMLFSIGLIAGKKLQDRAGYFMIAFGVWDIFYYLWLYVLINWPSSVLEWDILFLIPLPWWGPVLSPVLIAAAMAFWGYVLVLKNERGIPVRFSNFSLTGMIISILLILYTFMEYSISVFILNKGNYRPGSDMDFNWIVFIISFAILNLIFYEKSFRNRQMQETGSGA